MSGPGAFTQLVPTALAGIADAAACRGTRRRLDVEAVTCELAGRADWQSGQVGEWSVTGLAGETGWSWWRLRRALDALAADQVVVESRGELVIDLDRVRHRPGDSEGPPWVQVLPGAIEDLAEHHGWSRVATSVFTHCVLASDTGPDGDDRIENTSQTALAAECNTGWVTIHDGLRELSASGVVTAAFGRGQRVTLTVTGRAAVVRPQAAPRVERGRRRKTSKPHGPADDAARALWRHFGQPGLVPPGLVAAVRRAAGEGVPLAALVERVAAGGGLGGLRDPAAGLIARIGQTADAYREAAVEAAEVVRRREEATAAVEAAAAVEDDEARQAAADSRWVVDVLGPSVVAEIAERHRQGRVRGRHMVAGAVLSWARRAVAARADLDPASALHHAVGHDPPPDGSAPPIGADAEGPSIVDTLTA